MNTKLALLSLLLAGCTAPGGSIAGSSSSAIQLAPADAARVLDLVNYPGTDAPLLDVTVGLDSRAAHNIVATRDGADGVSPSADDVYFASLAQLSAVSYVGDSAIGKLSAYATAHPAPAGETVEGVSFLGWQSQSVVWGVSHATVAELDALLDHRAASELVGNACCFSTVAQMGPYPYVGPSALTALRGNAIAWWGAMHGAANLAGTFDSVSFDEATAETALAIANGATSAQLTAHGMTSTAAGKIVAARPYGTLAQLAAVSGVGTATMNALHGYATSGDWSSAPADCVSAFDDAVGPHLSHLLFLSESDRPFDLVSFPGAGTSAPTAVSVLALVGAPAGSTAESRDPNDYYGDFEPNDDGDPDAAAAVQAAFTAQLTDVVYIAVHAPAGSVDDSIVDVYLVGRTSCGDLVGIHSISIET